MTTPVPPDLAATLAERVVVLDGGLSTQLERQGKDVSTALWSAALLQDDPEAIAAAHRAYFEAGAEIATTASYQASLEGFAAAGLGAVRARELITDSVRIAVRARDDAGLGGRAWVAASVGPYGAVLAGGQEYTGDYPEPRDTVAGLRAFHRPRLELLAAAGADVLACETIPRLAEVEALLLELETLRIPAWISLTTVLDVRGRPRTRLGEDATEAFTMAGQSPHVVAVGVNCTSPDGLTAVVGAAASHSAKPVVVYPNSGEVWDGGSRRWRGRPGLAEADVAAWAGAGARLVGGCCRTLPEHIGTLRRAVGPAR